MKVNINGTGVIPYVGLIAPVYSKDLDQPMVAKVLDHQQFQVYVASNGVRITKANINEVFNTTASTKPVAPVVVEKTPEPVVAPVVEEKKEVVEEVTETVETEEEVETEATETEDDEEAVEESTQQQNTYNNKKFNNKKKHH